MATADALGVPFGPERGALQGGEAVTLADGRVVTPEEVLGAARPGRKLVLTGDTAPSDDVVDAALGADLLVHEATFCEDEAERARETEHSTALEAARVARDAGVRLLALTHLSSRYGGGDVEREARTVFPDTVVPRDFDLIEIPFQERGGPELVKSGARLPRAEVPSAQSVAHDRMVQVAVAGDVAEGEEIQAILTSAGIDSELQTAGEDDPLTVVVPGVVARGRAGRDRGDDRARRPHRRAVASASTASAGRARMPPDPLTRSSEAGKEWE